MRRPSGASGLSPTTNSGTTTMNEKYLYGEAPAEAKPAAGVKGVIIRSFDGTLMFRGYHDRGLLLVHQA